MLQNGVAKPHISRRLEEDIALWEWDDEVEENEVDYLEHFTTDYPLNKQNDADM